MYPEGLLLIKSFLVDFELTNRTKIRMTEVGSRKQVFVLWIFLLKSKGACNRSNIFWGESILLRTATETVLLLRLLCIKSPSVDQLKWPAESTPICRRVTT